MERAGPSEGPLPNDGMDTPHVTEGSSRQKEDALLYGEPVPRSGANALKYTSEALRTVRAGLREWSMPKARGQALRARRFAWTALVSLLRNDGPDLAATLAFFTILSLFPMASLAILVMSTFVDEEFLRRSITDIVIFFLPTSEDVLQSAVDQLFQARVAASVVALGGVLIGSLGLFMAASRAVNRVYGRRPKAWSRSSATGLVVTALMTIVFLISIGMGIAFRLAVHAIEANEMAPTFNPAVLRLIEYITLTAPFILTGCAFAIVYKVAPGGHIGWRGPIVGACTAVFIHEPIKLLFLWLADFLGERNVVYGSLSSAVILLSGAWTAAIIFLYGASVSKLATARIPKPVSRQAKQGQTAPADPIPAAQLSGVDG